MGSPRSIEEIERKGKPRNIPVGSSFKPGRNPMQAASLMIQHDIGRLPVVDNGRVIGIVTRSDTMRYFYDLLPEEGATPRQLSVGIISWRIKTCRSGFAVWQYWVKKAPFKFAPPSITRRMFCS
jgi:hypothetical protein